MEMFYYKDPENGQIYGYSQEDIDAGWRRDGLVELTPEELDAFLHPRPTLEQLDIDARYKRDRQFQEVYDKWINKALRFQRMAANEQEGGLYAAMIKELDEYAEALSRIPEQESYPSSITWPVIPDEPQMDSSNAET